MKGRRGTLGWAALALAAATYAHEGAAHADEKSTCADKYQSGQRYRAAGRLTLARTDLLRCAEQTCPAFVSNDCKTWLAQVDADLPALVFAVLDPTGRDVPSAVVRVDGVEVTAATDGLGHPVDPGVHVVEALARGQTTRQQVVARVGEKSRRIELRLGAASAAPPAAEPAQAPTASSSAEPSRIPTSAFVLGGVALLGIGAGSVLWVTGTNAASSYNALCESSGCTSSQRNGPHVQLLAGDVAWGVGLAAGIGALAVVLLHHGDSGTTVSIGPRGVVVGGAF